MIQSFVWLDIVMHEERKKKRNKIAIKCDRESTLMSHWSSEYEQHKQSKIYFQSQYDERKSFYSELNEINFTYVKSMTRFDNLLQSYKFDCKRDSDSTEIYDNHNEI